MQRGALHGLYLPPDNPDRMTDANSSLLNIEPFVRHRSYTLWRLEPHPTDPAKPPIKVPVHQDGTTHHHTRNPAPPLTADEARGWLAHHYSTGRGHATPGQVGYLGAGFRPEGTGLVCIDLDDCVTPEGWTHGALAVMGQLPGALIEQSIGGRGAHLWVTSTEAPGRCPQRMTPHGALEIYSEGQFIALGTVLGGDASVDHTAAVQRMVRDYWPERNAPAVPRELPGEVTVAVLADLQGALDTLDPDCSNDEWVSVGQALSGLGEVGYAMWAAWSARSTRFPGGDGLERWDTFRGERTDYRAIFAKAARSGWVNPAQRPALPSDASALFASAAAPGVAGFGGAAALPADMLTEPPPGRAVAAAGDLSFMAAAQGLIASTVASIETALLSPESGVRIAYDTFKDQISISIGDAPWRPFKDTDYGRLRAGFERRGFKPVPAEAMKTAVAMCAETFQFDSAQQWAKGITWDGTKRIDTAMVRYYGCEDTPYNRALGAYMFTTLGGRALVPGVKADMAIIMVGLQGARKTSSLEALVPEPGAFGEVDLSKDDDVIARKLRGKMVIELAEMRGFHGRDADANKAWVSRRKEEWTPKYQEFNTTYMRRCLLIGTANDMEQLDDPTGARRFLPTVVGAVDVAALRADCEQLWAEGIVRFLANADASNPEGQVEWEAAETLARAEHGKFEVVDELSSVIHNFMESPPTPVIGEPIITAPRSSAPISGADVLRGALNMHLGQIKKGDQMMLAKIMKKLGYRRATIWRHGANHKMWVKGGA